jgi:glycosyltransferase involved in cell wall biosynthesis
VETCLERAISSVLAQTFPCREIIVVDDGSTDETARVAGKFGRAIRLVRQAHAGAAAARNAGSLASRCELIAFLDADDEWLENKLARQIPLHREETVLSFSASHEFGFAGEDRGDTFGDWAPVRGKNAWKALLAVNFIATPTVIARRADLLASGGFDPCLAVGEDQDMWIRLALRGAVDFTEESLVRVHLRPGSLSGGPIEDQLDYTWPMILRHLENLSPRLTRAEIRRICARRLGRMGRTALAQGRLAMALPMIARAMGAGDRPLHNMWSLLVAASRPRRLRRSSPFLSQG